jgi:4-amino-4-deoxychorismate lyase
LVQDGQCRHLDYHQKRLNNSYKTLFSSQVPFDLSQLLSPPQDNQSYRCRFIYDQKDHHVAYTPYTPNYKIAYTFVEIDFDYPHKFLDRSDIDQARESLPHDVESIFIKDGLITDTSIANVACLIDDIWLTPTSPLLYGTTRARLLDEKKLTIADITLENFKKASKLAFFNALTGFYELKITHTI